MVYDLYRIYTGRAALQQPEFNYWGKAGVDIFTPMATCPRMVAIPFPDTEVFRSWPAYVIQYVSRYLRLRREEETDRALHFWLPDAFRERCGRVFPSLDVSLGVPWAEGTACWAEEVVGFLPGPAGSEVGREEVQALRQAWPAWKECADAEKRCVVWRGGALTEAWIEGLRARVGGRGWTVEEAVGKEEELAGASVLLWDSVKEVGQALWRLPKGATVIEGQDERDLHGQGQHLAHMADLKAVVLLFGRGSIADRQEEWDNHLQGLGVFS
jgi:hypothetical protein